MDSITNVFFKYQKCLWWKLHDKNSPKTGQKLKKTTIVHCTEGQNWMSVHPTVRPPAPTHPMGPEAFWNCIWFFVQRLFHQRLCYVLKFSTLWWLSFDWIFLQNCRFFENWCTTWKKTLTPICLKFAPECGVKQGAKLNIDYFVLHQRNFVIILTALFYIPVNAQTG